MISSAVMEKVKNIWLARSQASGNLLTSLLPARTILWQKIVADVFYSAAVASQLSCLMAECQSNSEYKCISVESLTQFKEILDGRIKTLHPKIYASLLFKRENKQHVKTFNTLNFPKIDFVIINLYPFKQTINQESKIDECIEMIDIGGPSLLTASAKNFIDVTTICDSKYYKKFLQNLNKNNGSRALNFRKQMSQKVLEHTSSYDKTISNWLNPKSKALKLDKEIKLKYGENPNQKASVFLKSKRGPHTPTSFLIV